ncbi:hypothetical protein Cni_G17980 [Canna indica]|uniref:Uncharacterized protein n=1 Tax=Canna indica TaxID=4628 RepID=A0AAQ3KNK1_9LILI|nr:hypothetical protein Cni_G17980 [Canna indica]
MLQSSRIANTTMSSSSSSLMTSHGVALATAVAVSGTMILLALCRPKPPVLDDPNSAAPSWCPQLPRSCISSSEERKKLKNEKKKKKKKRVQFAAEVVEFAVTSCNEAAATVETHEEERRPARRMPANRAALYNGILRDRVMQRMTYSY